MRLELRVALLIGTLMLPAAVIAARRAVAPRPGPTRGLARSMSR